LSVETETIYKEQSQCDSTGHLKTAAANAYNSQKCRVIDDEQITQYIPLVHKIVRKVSTYLKPPLTYDDLVSAGTVGLVKAANDYNPAHNAEFQTYAYIRIRGAILDELRGWSFVPASVNKQIRQATELSAEITEQTGSVPTNEELAEKMNISVSKLHKTFGSARAKNFVSIDDSSENSFSFGQSLQDKNTPTPAKQLEKAELAKKLAENISQLNEKQRQVVVLYYQQELNMKQIAEVLGISEPRVSQLHASALFNLSVKLKAWEND